MLTDPQNGPNEIHDLGASDTHQDVICPMHERLGQRARRMSQRVTKSVNDIRNMRGHSNWYGVLFYLFDGFEVDAELLVKNQGKVAHATD